jgi:protein required for attachment to host cells
MTDRPTTRWILICDASRARIYNQHGHSKEYELVQTLEHPESRSHVRDLVTDAHGRKPVGVPLGSNYGRRSVSLGFGRPGAEPDTNPKDVEAQKFARHLSSALEKGLNEHAYESLILVAPPRFLGILMATLNDEVAKHVERRVPKDLAKTNELELPRRVSEELGGR